MNRNVIEQLAKKYDSFYLYEQEGILNSIGNLKDNFPSVDFLFSVKCNPNENVLRTIFNQKFGVDAASLNEVYISKKLGVKKDDIYYSAPGKMKKDIEGAVENSVIIADSIREVERIQEVAKEKGINVEIGIRINPNFGFYSEVPSPSKFGIDEDLAFGLFNTTFDNLKIVGIHVHLRSQELNINVLKGYYTNMLRLANRVKNEIGELKFLNLGSGIGIDYAKEDMPLDLKELGIFVETQIAEFKAQNPETKIMIETGRYLVGKNGYYVTKVIDKKTSFGKTYVILKNTLNGFIRPSVEKMMLLTNPEAKSWEPLYTGKNSFSFTTFSDKELQRVNLVGNLCTATDVIAEDIDLPVLEEEDIVVINNAGAYAYVLSPMQFSQQDKPEEIMLGVNGEII